MFGIVIAILVQPKLKKADIAKKLKVNKWIKKPLLSNQDYRTNIELLHQFFIKNLSQMDIPAHTKKQSYEK